MTLEARFREIISPSIDEWVDQKISTVELERRKGVARQLAAAEDGGGSTAAAAAALARAEAAAAAELGSPLEALAAAAPNVEQLALQLEAAEDSTAAAAAALASALEAVAVAAPNVDENTTTKPGAEAVEQRARKPSRGWAIIKKPSDSSSHLAAHHVATWQADPDSYLVWPPKKTHRKVANPMATRYPGMHFINPNEAVVGDIMRNDAQKSELCPVLAAGCVRADATNPIWWEPTKVQAAMVTCGGLCPGLNSIIKGITNCLYNDYGVGRDGGTIWGVPGGYQGLSEPGAEDWVPLKPEVVDEIHMKGGSILKAGRGGFDAEKICDTLRAKGVNMLFVIGGDGTQFAGHLLAEEARRQNLDVSVVGVPKSIDNDVLFVDRTFGFDSAVTAASEVIRNGWIEATSCAKGVGVIKLMGRDAGFVAAHAALASNLVDLVLVPEVAVASMTHIYKHVNATLARKGSMVIVVAEGAMQEYVATGQTDATGHTIYGDIGVYLRDKLNAYLKSDEAPPKSRGGRTFYIDPSYIIRSVCATPTDHIYSTRLATNAVHTAMRGYTGVCVGAIHNVVVILKSKLIASGKKKLELTSPIWQLCAQSCRMPPCLTGIDPVCEEECLARYKTYSVQDSGRAQ